MPNASDAFIDCLTDVVLKKKNLYCKKKGGACLRKKVVIIGGGITGLTAMYNLQKIFMKKLAD